MGVLYIPNRQFETADIGTPGNLGRGLNAPDAVSTSGVVN